MFVYFSFFEDQQGFDIDLGDLMCKYSFFDILKF